MSMKTYYMATLEQHVAPEDVKHIVITPNYKVLTEMAQDRKHWRVMIRAGTLLKPASDYQLLR